MEGVIRTEHRVNLNGYTASCADCRSLWLGTAASYGIEKLKILADAAWAGLTITATFVTQNGATKMLMASDGVVIVPPEATAVAMAAVPGRIVFAGVADGVQRISCDLPYHVCAHAPIDGTASNPTPNEWQQFVETVKTDADRAANAAQSAKEAELSAKQSENMAESSADQAKVSEANAEKSAGKAAESESASARNAELAQQGAANAGYFFFEFGENGHLHLVRTENTPADIDFKINGDGRLIAHYG